MESESLPELAWGGGLWAVSLAEGSSPPLLGSFAPLAMTNRPRGAETAQSLGVGRLVRARELMSDWLCDLGQVTGPLCASSHPLHGDKNRTCLRVV